MSPSPASTATGIIKSKLRFNRSRSMPDFSYHIIRRPRRKTVGIVVRPNNDIEVLAPPHLPASRIEAFVQQKVGWIRKKLHFNEHLRASHQPRTFCDGEIFSLAGRRLTLKIGQTGRTHITVEGNDLLVQIPRHDPVQHEQVMRRRLTGWYRQQAQEHLAARVAHYAGVIGKQPSHVSVKNYKSRWGSCHRDGRIFFNWRLVMAPPSIIDYVVVHELCHLVHHNHAPAYWNLVESIMPDFRQARSWLKLNSLTLEL